MGPSNHRHQKVLVTCIQDTAGAAQKEDVLEHHNGSLIERLQELEGGGVWTDNKIGYLDEQGQETAYVVECYPGQRGT